MFGLTCGIVTTVIGAVLVILSSILGFGVVPGVIETIITNEMVLLNDTIQMERFEDVPFALNFSVRIFQITNADDVMNGGIPVVEEVGPYVYKLYQRRVIEDIEDDKVTYRRLEHYEFDPVLSYPHTEDDILTIANVAYHSVLQVAENMFPALMPGLGLGMNGIFGQYNQPVVDVRVGDLLFDGISICVNPGLIAGIACTQIRAIAAETANLVPQADGSIKFSVLSYKQATLSEQYVVHRGIEDSNQLGLITSFNGSPYLNYWVDDPTVGTGSVCNMVNGTDSGIFPPFLNYDTQLYALNTDVCRSAELRFDADSEYEGIPVMRFATKQWFLDNSEGCFCLNVTQGLRAADGCLLYGAAELYSCVGAFLVLTFPHFLYADLTYRNGVLGLNPSEEDHKIFVELEPNTGTVIRGAKRAQFNIFLRPVSSITATQPLRTTLTPLFWFEEGMSLPEEFVDEIKTRLLFPINLVGILLPVIVALSSLLLVIGIVVIVRVKFFTESSIPTTIGPQDR